MEGYTTSGLWLFILLIGCGRLSAFNLDTENVLKREGEPGSLFGFSLAMHRQLSPADKRILLVGAPKAKALNRQKSKVTGGLYKCEVSSNSDGCQRVMFDNNEDSTKEIKENQWLGASVSSQGPGGKVVTCAHRYQERRTSESRNIIGRCYVLNQDLTITSNREDGDDWHFCKGRNPGHKLFGSCQQGLSATFDKDYHYYIFGAPGAYEWKGVVRLEQRNDSFFAMNIFFDGPFETGSEREKNPELVPVPDNSYMGFSLDSGKALTNKGQLTVVAGAPRAYYSGAVVLLKKDTEESQNMLEEYTLKGEGLSSSFGYDLTVLDFNGDGWEDIVVGAPQYFEKDSSIGGAVYIYINKAGMWNEVKPTRIDGSAYSMFGLAVQNLGDINRDGYHDFAVGAPYEDGGAGKVYIYHGSATGEFNNKATQMLSGKPLRVKQFGYSLAGNMDLDRNSYPDMAVGSLSDAVFVYKSRPVVKIEKVVTFSPSKINLKEKNCGNTFCMEVKACFSYAANTENDSPTLSVMYNLEVDADRRKNNLEARGKFTEATDKENAHKSSGVITIDKKREQCVRRQLAIKEDIRDKLLAIPIDVSVNINQGARRKRRQTPASQLAPVLDAKDVKPTRIEVEFSKDGCGDDDVCQSNLKLQYQYVYKTADGNDFTPIEMENGVPMISLSDQKSVALEVTVTNTNGDDAYEASVIANFPRSVTYSTYLSPSGQVSCNANINGSMADCDVGNPFERNSKSTFHILLDTTNMSFNTTEVEVELKLNTASKQQNLKSVKAKAKVAITLQLSLSGQVEPSQVYFNEEAKGITDIKTETDIGSAIAYRFTIFNRGKRLKDIGTASLHIEWPKMTKEKKNLLYLMNINSTDLKQIECSPTEEINPNNMKPVDRKRRATNQGIDGTISRLIGNKKYQTLSCDSGVTCMTMKCPLGGLDNKAAIILNSRLWNSTFVEEYSDLHYVEVMVKASLHVDTTTKNTMLQNAETQVRLIVFPERRAARYGGGVAWWIILLSILFLLLLLGLLAFILWKCGVFKKNKEHPSDKEKLTSNA